MYPPHPRDTLLSMNAKYSWFRLLLISLFSFANVPLIFGASTYLSDSIGSTSNTGFVFVTNNTQKMVLDTSGNLGIGIASPGTYKFYANGNAYISGSLSIL